MIEPDNGKETNKYPGRVFITNIAIKHCREDVYIAIRTTCKEPSNNASEAAAFRPACLYYIYEDESMNMYEGGIEAGDYPISGEVICLKTSSEICCKSFCDDLISNKSRQMPVVLCPSLENKEFKKKVFHLASGAAGSAYVIVEETKKDYAKLFCAVLKDSVRQDTVKENFVCII